MGRIHDLTMTYTEDMRGVSFEQAKELSRDGWNAKTLHLYSHAGTHMDAPCHFGVAGPTIDAFEVKDLMVTCHVVDLVDIAPKAEIRLKDLGAIVDDFKSGEGLLLHTGWSSYAGQDRYRSELPRLSEEVAQWCVSHGVKMIGVEPLSVADVFNLEEVTRIHQVLLGGGVIIVEGLTNLDQISSPKVDVIALPLKIKDGDGAPARVIAIENETHE
ncbi:cyclase family protein [Marinoscillum furvescens]|uniref:Kynurenine formamidase n=1 Tax=Marinoscillum furvescens DSM 4134 TaxID=1122208 RepID=A0A3D9L8I9_MARFU|nr:cyclase family protein [Marinoscillum furvescens]REE01187.1 kynurenine formamidase [Marinoscillum furvescens DSM 4134]